MLLIRRSRNSVLGRLIAIFPVLFGLAFAAAQQDALAAASVRVDDNTPSVGDRITVSGHCDPFIANTRQPVKMWARFNGQRKLVRPQFLTDRQGNFRFEVEIPPGWGNWIVEIDIECGEQRANVGIQVSNRSGTAPTGSGTISGPTTTSPTTPNPTPPPPTPPPTPPTVTAPPSNCRICTQAAMQAELNQMLALYRAAVTNARRQGGFQCKSDKNYFDPGRSILHRIFGHGKKAPPGNCADWARVTWGALVTRTWNCWRVVKIRARRMFFKDSHNFVYITPRCGGGKRIIFDPYLDADKPNGKNIWNENVEPFWLTDAWYEWWIFWIYFRITIF